jgi:hypothetical protein
MTKLSYVRIKSSAAAPYRCTQVCACSRQAMSLLRHHVVRATWTVYGKVDLVQRMCLAMYGYVRVIEYLLAAGCFPPPLGRGR